MKLPLEMEIGRTSARFFWSWQNRYNALLKPYGLTMEQWRLLFLLSFKEGSEQQFLADQTMKAKSGITALLGKMSKAGLITRVADKNDGRNKKVYLTDKGRDLAEQGKTIIIEDIKRVFDDIEPEQIENMINIMQKITARIQ